MVSHTQVQVKQRRGNSFIEEKGKSEGLLYTTGPLGETGSLKSLFIGLSLTELLAGKEKKNLPLREANVTSCWRWKVCLFLLGICIDAPVVP